MKKTIFSAIAIVLLFSITGCVDKAQIEADNEKYRQQQIEKEREVDLYYKTENKKTLDEIRVLLHDKDLSDEKIIYYSLKYGKGDLSLKDGRDQMRIKSYLDSLKKHIKDEGYAYFNMMDYIDNQNEINKNWVSSNQKSKAQYETYLKNADGYTSRSIDSYLKEIRKERR